MYSLGGEERCRREDVLFLQDLDGSNRLRGLLYIPSPLPLPFLQILSQWLNFSLNFELVDPLIEYYWGGMWLDSVDFN